MKMFSPRFVIVVISFILLMEIHANAQTSILKLWPGDVPGEKESKHAPQKMADTSKNIERLSNVTDPALLVFEAGVGKEERPAILVCPGGGYGVLAMDIEGTEIAKWLNGLGYTAFVLQYRVPDKREGALQDIQRAMVLIRSQKNRFHINVRKLGVIGFSAGASLCARLSTASAKKYPVVDAIDSLSFRPAFALLIYPAFLDGGPNKTLSPELHIDDHTPPMFIFQTEDDPFGDNSLVMAAALRNAKIPVEMHLLTEGKHAYGIRKGNRAAQIWPVLASTWLEYILPKL
jgi:acetyl esterase/lipase